jgi:hypothetical protein
MSVCRNVGGQNRYSLLRPSYFNAGRRRVWFYFSRAISGLRQDFIVSRVASLDLLRGLAAWTVAIPHFFVYHAVQLDFFEAISILGVEIFFVLSGYVLAPQILLCVTEAKLKYLWVFLVRRWMRTVPAYIVALAFPFYSGRWGRPISSSTCFMPKI